MDGFATNKPHKIYEYYMIDSDTGCNPDNVEELNFMGKHGWELVAVRDSDPKLIGKTPTKTGGKTFYFKRELLVEDTVKMQI